MKIEDKVEVTLSKEDVESIVKDHLIKMGIKVVTLHFKSKVVHSDSYGTDEEFDGVNVVGKRA